MLKLFAKKAFLTLTVVSALFTLAACTKEYTITFDSQGGSPVNSQTVKEGEKATKPDDPTKDGFNFVAWYTSTKFEENERYTFNDPVSSSFTLYAKWSELSVVNFETKTSQSTIAPLLIEKGSQVSKPADPTRDGFVFKGWYTTKKGLTWLEDKPVTFPITVENSNVTLYAYWEPINSKTMNWSDGETYKNAFTDMNEDPIINPLVYKNSAESTLISYLSTSLFSTDINWDKAISDGLADYKGDLSKLNDSNIGSLVRENVLIGAANFPEPMDGDHKGEIPVDQYGKYSETLERDIMATTYRITLRDDILWEDGTKVTANDYLFSYLQYIDPQQNNSRSDSYYPSADRSTGMRIVNARNYYLQGTEIGFGEKEAGALAADYAKYQATAYVGPNAAEDYQDYVGLTLEKLFTKAKKSIYLTEQQAIDNNLVLGENILPENLWNYDVNNYLVDLDLRVTLVDNPYYVGEKGDLWPELSVEDLGFKVIDDYTFEMVYEVPTSYASALSMADFSLVHKDTYLSSLDKNGTNSTYGTPVTKPVSYGPYVIKSWDSKQKIVLNKNYNSISHKYYNYKSISFDFYPDEDSKINAFKQGKLSVASLNKPEYLSEFYENKNKKNSYDPHAEYIVVNAVIPESYSAEEKAKKQKYVSLLQDKDFRKALLLGFNRLEYTKSINPANVPSLLIQGGINATQYDNDPSWYTNTRIYKDMLAKLGIEYSTFGYDPTKAKELFNAAYDRWVAAGNSGKVVLKYLTYENDIQSTYDTYITTHYKTLFGEDKIDFEYSTAASSAAMGDKQDAKEFDICVSTLNYATPTNLSVYLPILGIFMTTQTDLYGFNSLSDLGVNPDVLIITEENKLDLRSTYNFLKAKYEQNGFDEETDEGTLMDFYEVLDQHNGYFVGDSRILYDFGLACTYIWAGLAPQYDGDVDDRNTVTAFFDSIILDNALLIPLSATASTAVYADNVVCEWPAYHNIMKWGQIRYWYLSSDPDFQ